MLERIQLQRDELCMNWKANTYCNVTVSKQLKILVNLIMNLNYYNKTKFYNVVANLTIQCTLYELEG